MKLVELFCGCGGFSLGAHSAGFDVSVAYDVDPILTSSYAINFKDTKLRLRDIAELAGGEIIDDVGEVPFGIFGGPPCQGFSDIGRRDKADPRRKLLGHFFRLVSEIEPVFFVMENVRGLAYADSRPVLDDALNLVNHRYDILGPLIWDAASFGAATKRNRMFVIGILKSVARPLKKEDVEAFQRKPATVKQAIADLANAREIDAADELVGFDRWRIYRRGMPSDYAIPLRAADNCFTGHRSTAHTDAVKLRFARTKPGKVEPIGRHPRLKWHGQCPTLRAGTGADKGSYQSVRPIHPEESRVITVREAARLQGFPDSHVFHPTIWHSFRMIGNSVSPIMSEAIFSALYKRLAGVDQLLSASEAVGFVEDGK